MKNRFTCSKILLLFSLIIGSSSLGYGQTNTSLTTSPAAKKKEKIFGVSASVGKSRSLYDFEDGSLQEGTDFGVSTSWKFSKFSTGLSFAYTKDDRRPENSDFNDIGASVNFKPWKHESFSLSPGIGATIPASKDSRLNKGLQSALSGRLNLSLREHVLPDGVSLGLSFSLGRNFHTYETAKDGSVNSMYSSTQGLNMGYSFGIFSIGANFVHVNSQTYNDKLKEAFMHSEEISAEVYKNVALTLGHTNGGSVFKANGYESNIQLINENSSMVYAQLGVTY